MFAGKKSAEVLRNISGRPGKRGVISEFLPWLLIALAVLVILMITIFVLKGTGFSLIDKIKALIGG